MIRKTLAVAATTALIMGGTTATANAQSTAPYPSSLIPIDAGVVQAVQDFTQSPADQVHAALQIGAAWAIWSIGSSVVGGGSSVLGAGSAALSS